MTDQQPTLHTINLYVSQAFDPDEAERLAAIMSEALEHHGFDRLTTHEPEPVPEWRQSVDAASSLMEVPDHDGFTASDVALWNALDILRDLVAPDNDREAMSLLARIVAVCEQELGDRWQAEPVPMAPLSAWNLGRALISQSGAAGPSEADWAHLGNRAAYWLATLTGEAS